jgi:phospholipase/carboxylesterase
MTALDLHVHRWVPAAEGAAFTLLLLHGTGGDENDLIPLAGLVAPGAASLSVRGNVLEHGAPRFFRRLREGVFDIEDLHRRTAELGQFLAAAGERYGFTPTSLYALGFSNGANIAASLLLSQPAALAGGVLIRAMMPFEPAEPPDLAGRAVLLSQGSEDPLVPTSMAERLATLLRASGADVELAWQPGGHGLTQGDVSVARRWLADRVASGPSRSVPEQFR